MCQRQANGLRRALAHFMIMLLWSHGLNHIGLKAVAQADSGMFDLRCRLS